LGFFFLFLFLRDKWVSQPHKKKKKKTLEKKRAKEREKNGKKPIGGSEGLSMLQRWAASTH
jgi:hypothetical protein